MKKLDIRGDFGYIHSLNWHLITTFQIFAKTYMQAQNLLFKDIVKSIFVLFSTAKDVPTSNSHIKVLKYLRHFKIISCRNPRILHNCGLKLVPFVRMEDKSQQKVSVSYTTRSHSWGLKD